MSFNVLFLSYDGMTDPLGQSQVLPYLEGLSRNGFTIHLISFEKNERYNLNVAAISNQCKSAGITWHPLIYTKKPPVLSTIYDLIKMNRTAEKLNTEFHFKLFHCRSQLAAMIGFKLAKKYCSKFIFDMRGFWVDERVEGNIWNIKNPVFKFIYNYLKRKEKELFVNADAVVSLTQKAIPLIHQIQEKRIEKQLMKVIPCCVDIDFFNSENIQQPVTEKLKEELNIPASAFILTYLGAIGTWYLCSEMLDFYKRLLLKYPDARFLFITQEDSAMILNMAAEKNIDTTKIIIKKAQRKDVPALLSLSDASVFFIKPSFSKQASSPTKQGELMSMGIPLICNSKIGDTDKIVSDTNAGVVCKDFSDAAYDDAINQLSNYTDKKSRAAIREGAKNIFHLRKV